MARPGLKWRSCSPGSPRSPAAERWPGCPTGAAAPPSPLGLCAWPGPRPVPPGTPPVHHHRHEGDNLSSVHSVCKIQPIPVQPDSGVVGPCPASMCDTADPCPVRQWGTVSPCPASVCDTADKCPARQWGTIGPCPASICNTADTCPARQWGKIGPCPASTCITADPCPARLWGTVCPCPDSLSQQYCTIMRGCPPHPRVSQSI